jgi:hypothetical protein
VLFASLSLEPLIYIQETYQHHEQARPFNFGEEDDRSTLASSVKQMESRVSRYKKKLDINRHEDTPFKRLSLALVKSLVPRSLLHRTKR